MVEVVDVLSKGCSILFFLAGLYVASLQAYHIRMYAIHTYGYVIHEFDPWFNYRATEYLAERGWHAFFHWYDYMSWYPLGRPVGTTIYPGMQIISVGIWRALAAIGAPMSLNDVCCLVPAWFGVSATIFCGLMAYECSGKMSAGVYTALCMAIVPAHIMRSVAGGFDNESVAMTAMMLVFYFWCRALRHVPTVSDGRATLGSYVFGALCGLSYIYMVAAWGGYIFVLNMVGAHAAVLVLAGRYSSRLHRAYSLFFVIGTAGAICVPPVGMAPFKSLEQLGPFFLFLGIQLLEYVEVVRRRRRLSQLQVWTLRLKLALPALGALALAVAIVYPTGYFGPLSSRIRGLFLKHTRTGNPLVDSVAEHQPGSNRMYYQYLHFAFYLAPLGFLFSVFRWSDANLFIVSYGLAAYFFANKMSRLVILLGPPGSVFAGVAMQTLVDFFLVQPVMRMGFGDKWVAHLKRQAAALEPIDAADAEPAAAEPPSSSDVSAAPEKESAGKANKKDAKKLAQVVKQRQKMREKANAKVAHSELFQEISIAAKEAKVHFDKPQMLSLRIGLGLVGTVIALRAYSEFYGYSHRMAEMSSRPQIMFKAQLQNGQTVMVDDYREAYFWLRDKTPDDARVMAWWDYGYQITGIGNRTSIADGNTWNHEHIATLGRILTAPEEDAHSLARHLADYVLVWAGGGGDDLAKSPHLARIGNSVFHGHCGEDPTCSSFGFFQDRTPTPMMENSLLYKLVSFGRMGVSVNESLFQHVHTTKYGKVRIYKIRKVSLKSKQWIADPANRICDAPGSWFCSGQYPPALSSFIASRHNFKQLEDFNVKRDAKANKYHEEYMRRMSGSGRPKPGAKPAAPAKDDL